MENREKSQKTRSPIWIAITLIVCGGGIFFFPFIENAYYQHLQAGQVEEITASNNKGHLPGDKEYGPEEMVDENIDSRSEEEVNEDFPESLTPDEGLLEIPVLDLSLKVGYGVELVDIEDHPGFYPQSGYPATGNVSIAGHRTTYGAPFRYLDKLEEGDKIKLYYREKVYIYEVEKVFPVHNRDWSVVEPVGYPALTLTTCHPLYSAQERLVVRAQLMEWLEEDQRNKN